MSVINQMLNQLERRGAHTVADQAMVRAVPRGSRNTGLRVLAFCVLLAAGIGAWQWVQTRKPADVPASVHGGAGVMTKAVGKQPDLLEPVNSTSQRQAALMAAPASGVTTENRPASRLSFELSSISLSTDLSIGSGKKLSHTAASGKTVSALHHTPEKHVKKPEKQSVGKESQKLAKTIPVIVSDTQDDGVIPDSASPMKQISPAQLADAEYRKATALMQQGRSDDAITGYRTALRLDANHDAARQALVAVLLENKRGKDAERVLQDGLKIEPDQTSFTMMLARLQVERGAVAEATATLQQALPYAGARADYQAFLAALLQRQNRNEESVAHYRAALKLAPNNGIWLMGYGISLLALKRDTDAKIAFQQALDSHTLSPDLQAFVREKIKGI